MTTRYITSDHIYRFFRILFALALACFFSGAILGILYGRQEAVHYHNQGTNFLLIDLQLIWMGSAFLAIFGFVQALSIIVIAEWFGIRTWIYYVLSVLLMEASLPFVLGMAFLQPLIPYTFITGPISGLIYWWIVGRTAGTIQKLMAGD